jgi:glycosyltransferase involved in cell wall biosynthesis
MPLIRRLLVVSTQDSTKLSSWSNVPFLFCKSLEDQGIELRRVTLPNWGWMGPLVQWPLRLLKRLGLGRESTWDYSRSALYCRSARHQIDQALQREAVDAVLVLSFSYGPSLPSKVPLYLFGDWPLSYAIECQRSRRPDRLELASICRENRLINSASEVFVLFPLAERFLKNSLPRVRSHYLGNVINAVEHPDEGDIRLKQESHSLLFVGKPHYLEGVTQLIEAYRELKPTLPALTLDIVGMRQEFLGDLPKGVVCHGYLDKGDPAQRAKYYRLLRSARLFVNPNPKWASFSAALEAMYFYTPLVTSAYAEMEETFGKEISFGAYCREGMAQSLAELLQEVMLNEDFARMARNAHTAASPFSWEAYVKRILDVVSRDRIEERST